MYVWVDALTNYLTATGYPDANHPRAAYWPASAHVIGKDITRFHAIYWPAFLMAADLPLPRQIVVHGFLFNRGEKMSKSLGNVIDPMALADHYGVDALRYFFLREVPFGQDGHYFHEAIVNRSNADLSNDLGNLAQRSLSMIAKNCDGKVPAFGALTSADNAILSDAYSLLVVLRQQMEGFALHAVLAEIWRVVAEANRYFAAEEPWIKRKSDPDRMASILAVTAEVLRVLGIVTQPFIPHAAGQLLDLLAVSPQHRYFAHAGLGHRLEPGTSLPAPSPIFPRYVEAEEGEGTNSGDKSKK
jgi:methionyl-tRNA synthetase